MNFYLLDTGISKFGGKFGIFATKNYQLIRKLKKIGEILC
jgi:hypothetical protein